ncbi:DNA-directed DNA polymerase gamma mip1, partial [Linderina macrospora]
MSLHVSSGGLCNQQRLHWVKYSKAKREQDEEFLKLNADTGKFFDVSSLNSLKEVALHYCGITMDKSRRNVFVDGTLSEIRAEFQDLMDYCACDVEITLRVFLKVLPAFLRKCPHPVSFAGMLMMSEGYLPVDKSWTEYVQRSENLFEQVSTDVEEKLRNLAEEALKVEDPMQDPWLKNLDWTIEPQKYTKPKFKKDGTYAKNGEPRPYTKQLLPGYPKWYREIWDRQEERVHVTVRSRVAPYLLKLKWIGYPLYHSALYGWTFCVPRDHYDACMLKLAHPSTAETHLDLPAFINMRPLEFPLDPESEEYEPIPARDREEAVYFK